MFLSKTHRSVYMLGRVARLPGAPCLLARGTLLGGVSFCHVNGSSRAIWANWGEINRENMAARSEYFRSYHWFASVICRTEWQSIWRDQCNRRVSGREQPVLVQEAKIRWKKVSLVGRCLLCLAAAQEITHAAHSLSRLGELHVKAGYVSTLRAG